jgi:hypothetical protein
MTDGYGFALEAVPFNFRQGDVCDAVHFLLLDSVNYSYHVGGGEVKSTLSEPAFDKNRRKA